MMAGTARSGLGREDDLAVPRVVDPGVADERLFERFDAQAQIGPVLAAVHQGSDVQLSLDAIRDPMAEVERSEG